jgi:hypothetical protein
MFLMTYYLSLLQVCQVHAKQDAPNEGHHQWRCHHHRPKEILWHWCCHCLQNDSYHGVTLEAGMFLTTYYLSLFQVHQVHAKQDAPNKGHHSGDVIIIAQSKSSATTAIASSTIATIV